MEEYQTPKDKDGKRELYPNLKNEGFNIKSAPLKRIRDIYASTDDINMYEDILLYLDGRLTSSIVSKLKAVADSKKQFSVCDWLI